MLPWRSAASRRSGTPFASSAPAASTWTSSGSPTRRSSSYAASTSSPTASCSCASARRTITSSSGRDCSSVSYIYRIKKCRVKWWWCSVRWKTTRRSRICAASGTSVLGTGVNLILQWSVGSRYRTGLQSGTGIMDIISNTNTDNFWWSSTVRKWLNTDRFKKEISMEMDSHNFFSERSGLNYQPTLSRLFFILFLKRHWLL